MEGKKYRALDRDCQAVSGVIGQVLMIALVVLAFSGIALTIFSDEGDVNPKHTPHTDLRENINALNSTVQIIHSGGDAIDLKEIKIVFSVKENQTVFNISDTGVEVRHPDGNYVTNGVFMYGDCIKINTAVKGVTFTSNDSVDISFIHTPSRQVIQRAVIQRAPTELPDWFTPYPYGTVCDKSGGKSEEWEPTELAGRINDGFSTETEMVQNKESSQNFTFGIGKYPINTTNPTKVFLKVIYSFHDSSQKNMTLKINVGGPDWTKVADLKGPNKNENGQSDETFNITSTVNTVEKLKNLTVRFSAMGNAASDNKIGWIDFAGVRVEY